MMLREQVVDECSRNAGVSERAVGEFTIERCSNSPYDTSDVDSEMLIRFQNTSKNTDRYTIVPLTDAKLRQEVNILIEKVNSNVELNSDTMSITPPSILSIDKIPSIMEWSSRDADYEAFHCIEDEAPLLDTATVSGTARSTVQSLFDYNPSQNTLKSLILLFSDTRVCELSSIELDIKTKEPHIYFSNVSTLREYCRKKAKDKDEAQKLLEKQDYTITTKIRRKDIDEADIIENIYQSYVNENISASGNCIIESEMLELSSTSPNGVFKSSTQTTHSKLYLHQYLTEKEVSECIESTPRG